MDLLFNDLSVFQIVILSVVGLTLIVQLFYYFNIYLRPALYKSTKENPSGLPSATVIICARNEYENLKEFLPGILEQEYPQFEVVVVNDCSEDDTLSLLGIMEQKYPNLRHTSIEPDRKFMHGKKLAVSIGIKSAKNEHLVFTDADCGPVSKYWLREIIGAYQPHTEIVLAYGGYVPRKGFVDKIVRFETLFIGMQYLGFALIKRPYMGIGRNMSYKKSLFFSKKGFSSHYKLFSGDDDLFINEHATKTNTKVVLTPESQTRSVSPENFIAWIKQKRRHLTTWKYYKFSDRLNLGIELASRMIFYFTLIGGFILGGIAILLGLAALLRLIVQLIVVKVNMNKFKEKGFLLFVPLFDFFMPFVHFELNLLNLRNKRNNQWK